MTIEIRALNDSERDYEDWVRVHNAVWPESPSTAATVARFDQQRPEDRVLRRWVASLDGAPIAMVGFGHWIDTHHPQRFWVQLGCAPEHRRAGLGARLYQHLLKALEPFAPRELDVQTKSNRVEAIGFLERRGFEEIMRVAYSELDVGSVDPASLEGVDAAMQAQGIELLTFDEYREREPDWLQICWDFDWIVSRDIPTPDPITRIPLETFRGLVADNPNVVSDGFIIAVDGDRLVGTSNTRLDPVHADRLYTGLTAVLREYRRRGIATAMKRRVIAFAQGRGIRVIRTDNEENNPMFALNLQLGFERLPDGVVMRQTLTDESRV